MSLDATRYEHGMQPCSGGNKQVEPIRADYAVSLAEERIWRLRAGIANSSGTLWTKTAAHQPTQDTARALLSADKRWASDLRQLTCNICQGTKRQAVEPERGSADERLRGLPTLGGRCFRLPRGGLSRVARRRGRKA